MMVYILAPAYTLPLEHLVHKMVYNQAQAYTLALLAYRSLLGGHMRFLQACIQARLAHKSPLVGHMMVPLVCIQVLACMLALVSSLVDYRMVLASWQVCTQVLVSVPVYMNAVVLEVACKMGLVSLAAYMTVSLEACTHWVSYKAVLVLEAGNCLVIF